MWRHGDLETSYLPTNLLVVNLVSFYKLAERNYRRTITGSETQPEPLEAIFFLVSFFSFAERIRVSGTETETASIA